MYYSDVVRVIGERTQVESRGIYLPVYFLTLSASHEAPHRAHSFPGNKMQQHVCSVFAQGSP